MYKLIRRINWTYFYLCNHCVKALRCHLLKAGKLLAC